MKNTSVKMDSQRRNILGLIERIVPAKKKTNLERNAPKDFIRIHGTNNVISAYPIQGILPDSFHGGMRQITEMGLEMPTPHLFLRHFLNLVECLYGNNQLLDISGTPFSQREVWEIFYQMTREDVQIEEGGYHGGIWLGAEYTSSEIRKDFVDIDRAGNIFPGVEGDESGIFIKMGMLHLGPFCVKEGKLEFRGGSGMGDTFRFYARGGEYYLDGKCNPCLINNSPRAYGVLDGVSCLTLAGHGHS